MRITVTNTHRSIRVESQTSFGVRVEAEIQDSIRSDKWLPPRVNYSTVGSISAANAVELSETISAVAVRIQSEWYKIPAEEKESEQ